MGESCVKVQRPRTVESPRRCDGQRSVGAEVVGHCEYDDELVDVRGSGQRFYVPWRGGGATYVMLPAGQKRQSPIQEGKVTTW